MATDYNSFKRALMCSDKKYEFVQSNPFVQVSNLDKLGKKTNINAELIIKVYQSLQETMFEFYELFYSFATSLL
jgi:hypothetical protein